jgi:competence protein ComEA
MEECLMNLFKQRLLPAVCVLMCPVFAFAGPVNVNTADAETISEELKGVGLSKAIAIVEYRDANGPFKAPDDLALVKGIGTRTVEINKDNILVRGAAGKHGN